VTKKQKEDHNRRRRVARRNAKLMEVISKPMDFQCEEVSQAVTDAEDLKRLTNRVAKLSEEVNLIQRVGLTSSEFQEMPVCPKDRDQPKTADAAMQNQMDKRKYATELRLNFHGGASATSQVIDRLFSRLETLKMVEARLAQKIGPVLRMPNPPQLADPEEQLVGKGSSEMASRLNEVSNQLRYFIERMDELISRVQV
jgi:hypothetical protein